MVISKRKKLIILALSILAVLLVVVTIVFCVNTAVQIIEKHSILWVESKGSNTEYPIMYSYENCTISPRKDGQGVRITAYDPNHYGKPLYKTIFIEKNKAGGATKRERYTVGGFILGRGYDVFYVKYEEAAKELPPEVKKVFFGYYCLESED